MLFHTFAFLVFFVIVFTVYWILRGHRARMIWLLAASIYFYASWNPWLISLIAFSASVDYAMALLLERTERPATRKLLLVLSVGTNLGLLAFFKYVNFFLESVSSVVELPSQWRHFNIILPLGISFYTFETISYIVDVYYRRVKPVRSILDYGLYIMFFPHLIAGPIVRANDFLPQLGRRKRFSWTRMQLGVWLFLIGLFKKAVLADHVAIVIDPVFEAPAQYGSAATWLAILGYAVQVYCDFSGYSDMALGLAHMLGFHLPANFRMPYLAVNVVDLWRRWHISLSSWLRDYLFVPLGGSRRGKWLAARNVIITMTIGGLWHGANWPCVMWGFYNGVLLAAHRIIRRPTWFSSPHFRPWSIVITFVSFCVGLAIFRCQSLGEGYEFITRMFWPVDGASLEPWAAAVVKAAVLAVFAGHLIGEYVDLRAIERRMPEFAVAAAYATVLLFALVLQPESGKVFIYFQF